MPFASFPAFVAGVGWVRCRPGRLRMDGAWLSLNKLEGGGRVQRITRPNALVLSRCYIMLLDEGIMVMMMMMMMKKQQGYWLSGWSLQSNFQNSD